MALIKCPECGKMISDKAQFCVGCGYPIELVIEDAEFIDENNKTIEDSDYVILEDFACQNMGKDHAILLAKEYLESQGFSKKGLIEQLEYEGYTRSEALYVVKKCGVDWNLQAVRSAKEYLESQGFSKKGLIEQLEYDGYTKEQSLYGISKCGANWKQQAILVAKSYLESMSFSRDELIEQLEYEGFTYEEAQYAVDKTYI